MKWVVVLCLILSGCETVQERDALSVIRENASSRVAHFNSVTGSNIPVPYIIFGTPRNAENGNYATAFKTGEIVIEPNHCLADMDKCLNDALPHELAHEAIFFLYPQDMGHNVTWCDAMRKMGGKPEDEKWENCPAP